MRPKPIPTSISASAPCSRGSAISSACSASWSRPASNAVKRTGEFKVKGLGDKAHGIYGVSVRVGIGGEPHVERFGNIRTTHEGPEVVDVREPLIDVFDEDNEIVVAAELPGVKEDAIEVDVRGDVLALSSSGERRYAKEVLLPSAVDAASMKRSFKNGLLELRLKKA